MRFLADWRLTRCAVVLFTMAVARPVLFALLNDTGRHH
jgi:hypothetical protein